MESGSHVACELPSLRRQHRHPNEGLHAKEKRRNEISQSQYGHLQDQARATDRVRTFHIVSIPAGIPCGDRRCSLTGVAASRTQATTSEPPAVESRRCRLASAHRLEFAEARDQEGWER